MPRVDAARRKEYNRTYYRAHREEERARVRSYYETHREKENVRARTFRAEHPEYSRVRRYGLTQVKFERLFTAQAGVCAICKKARRNGKGLHVDHDHDTGEVRALLCKKCNTALGLIEEDPEIAKAMVDYLKKFKAVERRCE